jgi:hypothetical protein
VSALKAANLTVKFVVEVVAVAAFAYRGASRNGVLASVIAGIAAPASAVVSWGLFAAPRSRRRLPLRARVPFEPGVFAFAAAALLVVGRPAIAMAFVGVVIVNAALVTRLAQWEQ